MTTTTLFVFTGADGATPIGGVTLDTAGDIFGTTFVGGSNERGTVFEIKAGSTTATTVYSFTGTGTDGANPQASVTLDAAADIFGTTTYGGSGRDGTVFEIKAGSTTATTLYSFTGTGADGANPFSSVTLDAAGDLFGTTYNGGSSGDGTVFEIKAGSTAATTLYGFTGTGTDGANPGAGVTLDAAGDIFGTTRFGGSDGDGTVFEITAGTTTATTLYSFTGAGTDGFDPEGGVTLDAAGDIFGTAAVGGAFDNGTVFEIKAGTTVATTLYSFAGTPTDGANPDAGVTLDAAGDIFGATEGGGPRELGTVFEIKAGSATATTLHNFSGKGTDGVSPQGGVTLDPSSGDLIGTTAYGGPDYDGTVFEISPPCYRAGTLIQTDRGRVPVEALVIGDSLPTVLGGPQPIQWIGHRRIDCRRHPRPQDVWPVRVSSGAFDDHMPRRDLWLSPDHAVFVDDLLIPIKHLINDRTIAQVPVDAVTHYHVELPAHDVLLAEGLPCESYLDTGNRTAFMNGGAFVEAHPDFSPRHWTQTCRPMIFDGPAMNRTRELLFARAGVLGHAVTGENGAHLIAAGRRIEPVWIGAGRILFELPLGCADISLRSRCFVPAHTRPPNTDTRSLGLCVGRLHIDGTDINLDDDQHFQTGWHALERGLGYPEQRWTLGVTPMPSRARSILINLAGPGYYWWEPAETSTSLAV